MSIKVMRTKIRMKTTGLTLRYPRSLPQEKDSFSSMKMYKLMD